jgi:hypothetical protein
VLGVQGGRPAFRDRYDANCVSETSYQTNLTSLPVTRTVGTDWPNSCPLSAYALGSATFAVLTSSPSSVNFENVIVGDSSALPVLLTNTASLTISAAGATGAAFGMSGLSLPLTLNSGNTKSLSADFAPTARGEATGQVSLTSNASDPSLGIPLTGTGVKGHSVTLSWTASTSKGRGVSVFAGAGERTREGNDLHQQTSEAGVIKQDNLGASKIALVYGQVNEPPGARLRVAQSCLSVTKTCRTLLRF